MPTQSYASKRTRSIRAPEASYTHDLRNLSAALRLESERARRRGLFGLAERLREAGESAASWAAVEEVEEG